MARVYCIVVHGAGKTICMGFIRKALSGCASDISAGRVDEYLYLKR